MRIQVIIHHRYFDFAVVAALSVICGWLLWLMPLGESWKRASYDYLFRFGARANTNQVTLVLMDNSSFAQLKQTRGEPWDRGLHAQLLNRLADDGCRLVIFDSFFRAPRAAATDTALVNALRRQNQVLLMAEQAELSHPDFLEVQPILPEKIFLEAARTNWGVAWLDPDMDSVVRRLWPFPSPGPYASLPWQAASLMGAELSTKPAERWLRYYGPDGPGAKMSYSFALSQPTNYFHNQVVFIGTQPSTTLLDGEVDKFATPYSSWTGESSAGVKIMATAYLNLLNGEWLRRWPAWFELGILLASGLALGVCSRLKPITVCVVAGMGSVGVSLGAISWSYFTNDWFPWLIVAGGQIPCALVSVLGIKLFRVFELNSKNKKKAHKIPVTPGYELFQPPIGEGAYGVVWLARSQAGQWCAVKAVYQEKFGKDLDPFDREFNGVTRYQPLSGKYPGLLRVEFVSQKQDGYFYYVMELGDSLVPGWEKDATCFKPHNLGAERARHDNRRLPVCDCLRLGAELAESLELFHQHELIHRDIKPENIMFVNGRPKFADFGLIADRRPTDQVKTFVGTAGYMPPPPECPGTTQADIYALGMVLYVLSTGRAPDIFPAIATTLVTNRQTEDFFPLNRIITKACQPEPKDRYASAKEMHAALKIAAEK